MEAFLTGSQVVSQCLAECRRGSESLNYLVTKRTSCELILNNLSYLRADVAVWINDEKLGTWAISDDSSVRIVCYPSTNDSKPLRFTRNSKIVVKFFKAYNNSFPTDRALTVDEIDTIKTTIMLVTAVNDLLITDSTEGASGYIIPTVDMIDDNVW